MNKFLVIKTISRLTLAFFIVYCYVNYKEHNHVLKRTSQIQYHIVNKKKHSGGRGDYHTADVEYNSKIYTVDITSEMFKDMQDGNHPELYYADARDKIISDWCPKKLKRLMVLGIIGLTLTFIPFKKPTGINVP